MRDKLINFLRKSYGFDPLSRNIYYLGLGFFIIGVLLKSNIARYLSLFFMIVSLLRSFSRNKSARYNELVFYNKTINRIKTKYKVLILNIKHYKTHKYVICKKCNQQLRLPKKQGKIVVSCPRCHNKFDVRT